MLGLNTAQILLRANLSFLSQPSEPNDGDILFPFNQFYQIIFGLMFTGIQVFSALESICQRKSLKNPFLNGLSRISSCHGNLLANNLLSTWNFSSTAD